MTKRKLIEVSLPLEQINKQAAREKSIRHGHPSTLHLWWARRPLAAARAVLFSQLVDDPSSYADEYREEGAAQGLDGDALDQPQPQQDVLQPAGVRAQHLAGEPWAAAS